MKYVIIELQKFADGSVAVPPISTADDFFQARSIFHGICATAAISQVPVHSVVLMTETGQEIGLESFNHTAEPAE
jgi:hypothetical protein